MFLSACEFGLVILHILSDNLNLEHNDHPLVKCTENINFQVGHSWEQNDIMQTMLVTYLICSLPILGTKCST